MIDLTVLFGGMWIWGLGILKAVECFKWSLMNHSIRNMEDVDAENDLNSGSLARKVSDEKNFSM